MRVSRPVAGVGLCVVGLGLIANPLYLDAVSIYPGGGWQFLPMFHAALTALGALCGFTGAGRIAEAVSPRLDTRTPVVWALATVVFVPVYGIVLEATTSPSGEVLTGYGARKAFVAALIASAFLLGTVTVDRRRRPAAVGMALPLVALFPVLVEWRTGALLGPVLDVYFLLTGAPILEIPYLGSVLIVAAFVLGGFRARGTAAAGSTRHSTGPATTKDPDDTGDGGHDGQIGLE